MDPHDPLLEPEEEMALSDLVGRVLDRGTVITGDVVISVAGVDLIQLGLNLFLASAETARHHGLQPTPFRIGTAAEGRAGPRIGDPGAEPAKEDG